MLQLWTKFNAFRIKSTALCVNQVFYLLKNYKPKSFQNISRKEEFVSGIEHVNYCRTIYLNLFP